MVAETQRGKRAPREESPAGYVRQVCLNVSSPQTSRLTWARAALLARGDAYLADGEGRPHERREQTLVVAAAGVLARFGTAGIVRFLFGSRLPDRTATLDPRVEHYN